MDKFHFPYIEFWKINKVAKDFSFLQCILYLSDYEISKIHYIYKHSKLTQLETNQHTASSAQEYPLDIGNAA